MENAAASAPIPIASDARDPDLLRLLREDGTLVGEGEPAVEGALAVDLHRAMVRARALDARLVALHREGRIASHASSRGEEAALIGAAAALRDVDWLFPTARDLGAALVRGLPLETYAHHVFANDRDPSRGREEPDHFGHRRARIGAIGGGNGAHVTHAAGFAWAAKIRRDPVVALVTFDAAAADTAELHNGANFAGVQRVPLVLFCKSAPDSARSRADAIAAKGLAYGIPTLRCDGADLFAVLAVTREAAARALAGEGATWIDCVIPKGGEPDPIARVRRHLARRGLWSETAAGALDAEIDAEIDAAIDAAEALPPPQPDTMFEDVFAAPPWHLEEQRRALAAIVRAPKH